MKRTLHLVSKSGETVCGMKLKDLPSGHSATYTDAFRAKWWKDTERCGECDRNFRKGGGNPLAGIFSI